MSTIFISYRRIQDITGLTKVRKRMISALLVMASGVLFGLLASAENAGVQIQRTGLRKQG